MLLRVHLTAKIKPVHGTPALDDSNGLLSNSSQPSASNAKDKLVRMVLQGVSLADLIPKAVQVGFGYR